MDQDLQDGGDFNDEDSDGDDDEGVLSKRVKSWFGKVDFCFFNEKRKIIYDFCHFNFIYCGRYFKYFFIKNLVDF